MANDLSYTDLTRMLRGGANRLKENHALLTALDTAIGDGDHGNTMKRVGDAILEAILACQKHEAQPLLEAVGWTVMSIEGGASSPLLGSFFMGVAEGANVVHFDGLAVASAFEKGLVKMRSQTSAQVGDKTMLDALEPAVTALRLAVDGDSSMAECFALAADAADFGAQRTEMQESKFGRARGATFGHIDPGAMSIAFLFAGFRDGVAESASAHA